MVNRVDAAFASLRARKTKGVVPFIVGGSPAFGDTAVLIPALARAGAAVIEVGIPFSDPIADGPVIAEAMHRAIARGTTPRAVFEQVAAARHEHAATQVPVIAMMSVSLAWRMGFQETVTLARESGIDGFIFPDMPLEESEEVRELVRRADLVMPMLIAPTTPAERAAQIARASSGFVYLLARTGITGEGQAGAAGAGGAGTNGSGVSLGDRVRSLRAVTGLPIACGFGIARPEDVRATVANGQGGADAAIVGTALVRRLNEAGKTDGGVGGADRTRLIDSAEAFVRGLVHAAAAE